MAADDFVTPREHLMALLAERHQQYLQRFDSMAVALLAAKEAVGQANDAADRALTKAEAASERRFEGVNEFRQTLADSNAAFARKTEMEVRLSALDAKIDSLVKSQQYTLGIAAAISFMIVVAGLVINALRH